MQGRLHGGLGGGLTVGELSEPSARLRSKSPIDEIQKLLRKSHEQNHHLAKPTLGSKTTSEAALAFAEAGAVKQKQARNKRRLKRHSPEGYRRLTIKG